MKHYSTVLIGQLFFSLTIIASCSFAFCQSPLGSSRENKETQTISFEKWYHTLGMVSWNTTIPIRKLDEIDKIESVKMTNEIRSQSDGNLTSIEITKENRTHKFRRRGTRACFGGWGGETLLFVPPPPPTAQHHFRG
ncbi:MAG: hypothetical protein SFU99_08060 [Saprospiraceae bacterium]|nr:hypothetical protein [Saprospiraceae bacterium]